MENWVEIWGVWGALALKIGQMLLFLLVILVSLAFVMLADRKIWAAVQYRRGPNVVGPFGLLQSFADFLKFMVKEIVIPAGADRNVFLLAPLLTFIFAFMAWAVIPVAPNWVIADINVGVLYILAVSSLGVYGVIMGGWASNSKYPFLGSLRSAAQMVSYEVSIGLILLNVLLLVGSLNLTQIVDAQAGPYGLLHWHAFAPATFIVMFPMFVMFFISALAETNRPPFDLPEAEAELVAGYQVEYSSTPFLLFFAGELVSIVMMCGLIVLLFLGGWHAPFPVGGLENWPGWLAQLWYFSWFFGKTCFIFFLFSMVKAIVPRYRYDQLMRIGWKLFLPTSVVAVTFTAIYVTFIRNGLGG